MAGELFDQAGNRKYLIHDERRAFLKAADKAPREVRTFCHLLHFSGCRISEALALTCGRVDFTDGTITFESLKKRRGGVYRSIPVPPTLLDALDLVHNVRGTEARRGRGRKVRIWTWERTTAWRKVKAVMEGGRSWGRTAGQPQGAAARLRGCRRHDGHPAQHGAEVARARPALHHGDLRRRGRGRGEEHRQPHVVRQMTGPG